MSNVFFLFFIMYIAEHIMYISYFVFPVFLGYFSNTYNYASKSKKQKLRIS